ncbi:MAG: hypothetical protein H6678_09060 [Candidatus Delongbacteria bacterium]|nr:hypothetical protein [Candidatus Delongbacteria bacterium]
MIRPLPLVTLALSCLLLCTQPGHAGDPDLATRLRLRPSVIPASALQFGGSFSWRSTLSNPGADAPRSGAGFEDQRLLLHSGRLLVGARTANTGARLRWGLQLGGTLAENSLYSQRILTPEARLKLDWRQSSTLDLSLFSRHGWTEANRFMADSTRRRDWITGIGLDWRSEWLGQVDLRAGNRRSWVEGEAEDTRFLRGELRATLPGDMRLRAFGESMGYGLQDSLDFDLARNQVGVQLSGALPWQGRQHGELQRTWREGRVRWLVSEGLSLRPLPDHLFEARYSSDWGEWQDQDLFRRDWRAAWNWSPRAFWGLRLLGEGSWTQIDQEDVDHERAVLVGPWLHSRPLERFRLLTGPLAAMSALQVDGSLDAGLKQSARWGDGVDVQLRDAVELPVQLHPLYTLRVEQRLSAEWLMLQDGDELAALGRPLATETPHEVDSRLALGGESGPVLVQGLRLGHRHSWQRHLGSEIVFPLDSLRNTLQHEIWARQTMGGQQLRLSLSHIRHTQQIAERAIEYRCALGWQAIAGRMLRGGGDLVWRPERGALSERMWLRLHGELHWRQLEGRLQGEFSGDPADLGQRDTRFWLQLTRNLW